MDRSQDSSTEMSASTSFQSVETGKTEIPVLRLGAVSYLNSKPLVWNWHDEFANYHRVLDYPSNLADELAAGRLDIALVPIIEHFQLSGSAIVSDACVACQGLVHSVKAYFRCKPHEVSRIALDQGSRTSAALLQVLLKERHGVRPDTAILPHGIEPESVDADALLVIGDRAMHPPDEEFVVVWDLGLEWYQQTGLPFVFAAWISRPGVDSPTELAAQLAKVRDSGVAAIDEIARIESLKVGLSAGEICDYLTDNLRFRLSEDERRAIALFAKKCRELDLIQPR